MSAQSEARAWLAGIQHVMDCPGCPCCLLVYVPPAKAAPVEAEDQTLNESVSKERK
jgi:hypothetical protein